MRVTYFDNAIHNQKHLHCVEHELANATGAEDSEGERMYSEHHFSTQSLLVHTHWAKHVEHTLPIHPSNYHSTQVSVMITVLMLRVHSIGAMYMIRYPVGMCLILEGHRADI